MKLLPALLSVAAMLLTGCDTIYGVSRRANVHALPDLQRVKARIEAYPEIEQVKFEERLGSRPLTLCGIKPADELYYLSYSGGGTIRGTLMFERNYKGEVWYNQTLPGLNRKPPQELIDATWPVMKKIESDLEQVFGLHDIRTSLKVMISGVDDPDREKPNKAPEPTPGSVTPRATEGVSK